MKHSILLSEHESAGARLTDGASGPIVLTYGDVPAEYRAAQSDCLLIDETDRGLLHATGGDASDFLHRLLANDVRGVAPGLGNANLLLTAKGKVVHGFDLFRRADEVVLSTEPGTSAALAAALEMYHFSEDITLEDRSESHAPLTVCGESAASVVAAVVGEMPTLADHEHVTRDWNGHELWIAAVRFAGLPGLRLDAGPEGAVALWRALHDAGAAPAGLAVRDILRCEAGVAAHGTDITEDVYPQEARLEHAISLEKGCYIGQEVVAKIDTYGGLNKRLMALAVSHDDPIPVGAELLKTGEDEVRALGLVTSWSYSFALDTGIILAYVKRKHQEIGTTFALRGADGSATIVNPPLTPPGSFTSS